MSKEDEENKDKCNFKDCKFNEDGICFSKEARAYCLEIANAVLCKDEDIEE